MVLQEKKYLLPLVLRSEDIIKKENNSWALIQTLLKVSSRCKCKLWYAICSIYNAETLSLLLFIYRVWKRNGKSEFGLLIRHAMIPECKNRILKSKLMRFFVNIGMSVALIFFCVEIIFIIIIKTAKTRTTFYAVIRSLTSYLFQPKRMYKKVNYFSLSATIYVCNKWAKNASTGMQVLVI